MLSSIRRSAAAVAALAALGLGGAAIADAAEKARPAAGSATSQTARPEREALASDVAAKVEAAALAEVSGANVLRTEAGGPYDSAYHAHLRTADGALRVVLVNEAFEATAVRADAGRRDRGRDGDGPGRHGGAGETVLAGEKKEKVEAAVLAKYPSATIVRTETNGDSRAPYESHIRTSAGEELEVLVDADFAVVEARAQRGHR